MGGDVIGFVAFDFILWVVFGGMVGIAFIIEIGSVDLDDCSGYFSGFGVPAYFIAWFELMFHNLGE